MESKFFYEWIKKIVDSGTEGQKKSMSIILLDETGETEKKDVARWDIVNAWPTKYKPADLNAKTNDVAIESLEIAHEGFSRVS
jgi:phage tail-like protein